MEDKNRVMRILFRVIASLGILLIPLVVNSHSEDSEAEIRALKEQIEQIQRQNQKQIEELRKKIQELEAKKAPAAPPTSETFLKNFDAGYKEGLFIKTTDNRFSLKFNVLLQVFMPQIQDFSDNTTSSHGGQDENIDFQIRRLRLIFSGNGFFPWLTYYVQVGADKGGSFQLFDAYTDWGYFKEATPRAGQYKVPFQREELISDPYIEFAERSIDNDQFTLGRDIGASLYGSLFNNKFEYYGGIFNGSGRNSPGGVNGTKLLYAGRIMFEPLGKYPYTQADLEDPTKPLLAMAAAFAYFPNFNPLTENQNDRANLSNTVLALNKNAQAADVFQFTADLGFKYCGFGFEAEYDLQRIGNIVSTLPTTDAQTEQGLRLQLGYIFLPTHFELAFRYAIAAKYCQNNIAKVGCQTEQEYTPGLNYYIWGRRLKLALNYSYLRQNAPSLGGHVFDNKFIVQSQFFF